MTKPFLWRKILPWLYVFIFLISSPILILYTSGYRYNSKKNQLERNGTVIIDSTPKSAQVFLDGQDTGEKTPITLQNITPGWHSVRIEKAGYTAWNKNLEVRSEQVVFANQIWLWRQTSASPNLILPASITRVETDPLDHHLGLVIETPTTTELGFWIPDLLTNSSFLVQTLPGTTSSTPMLRWSEDGRFVLVGGWSPTAITWWSSIDIARSQPETLPNGFYRWSGQNLIGSDAQSRFRLVPQTDAFSRENIQNPQLIDEEGSFALQASTSTGALTLTDRMLWTRSFALPSGNWRLMERRNPFLLFKDDDRWLAINPQWHNEPYAGRVVGDHPRWLSGAKTPTALFVNQNELWQWTLGNPPSLLWRQSEPLVQAAWHRSGNTVFIATKQNIFALDIDDRDGHVTTPIASFDHIYDFAILDKVLYVAAEKNGQRGLWKVAVE